MIDQTLYEYIRDNLTLDGSFNFGSAEGETTPYTVMFKVSDLETPVVLCNAPGDSGEALFQFSRYEGGSAGVASNVSLTVTNHEALKNQVNDIKGVIGTSPNDYRIWSNQTGGVFILNDGSSSLKMWGAVFEMVIRWEKI